MRSYVSRSTYRGSSVSCGIALSDHVVTLVPTLYFFYRRGVTTPALKCVRVFLSFADLDGKEARDLWDRLEAAVEPSDSYRWHLWAFDKSLLGGVDFDAEIQDAVADADLGIFALSRAFLSRPYIQRVELPPFLASGTGRRILPVMLKPLPQDADLRGLQARQIFGFHDPYWSGRRPHARDEWANRLADEMHRVARRYGLGR